MSPISPISIPTRNILALDLGNLTGWALWTPDSRLQEWGVMDFTPRDTRRDDSRWFGFSQWLAKTLQRAGTVVVEDIPAGVHRGRKAAQVYGGYRAISLAFAARYCERYYVVTPGTWKKAVLGNGNAKKADAIAAARLLTDNSTLSSDEADAILIGKWGVQHMLSEEGKLEP